MKSRITAITVGVLALTFMASALYFRSPNDIFQKFRDFGNITKTLDLIDEILRFLFPKSCSQTIWSKIAVRNFPLNLANGRERLFFGTK